MFENIGNKIMTCVRVVTALGFGISIIGGIWLLGTLGPVGLIVMVLGCLFSWVGGFFLYGFGQLVRDAERLPEIRNSLGQLNVSVNNLQRLLENGAMQTIVQPEMSNVQGHEQMVAPTNKQIEKPEEIFYFQTRENGDIYCPNCGSQQPGNRDKCWECSAKFVYEDEQ